MNNTIALTSFYAGNIQYYSKLAHYPTCVIDMYQHYEKQTYRNRCRIATANGPMDLTIPVVKPYGNKTIDKEVKIADEGWQKIHWRALESAYKNSPFFMYYEDDFRSFYQQKYTYLTDFNQALQACICQLIGIQNTITESDHFLTQCIHDYRNSIHTKHPAADKHYSIVPYYQVFEQKYGFIANLSIFDLLFNMGNESILVLQQSYIP